ncbi:hypothetical protein ACFO4E_01295 [Nocardiopsis mangrovi]|uniref:DivIVA domain-containing protein n=1 Tax=Nocardiopsis mangrovi TaxID=1179818 RepID=A0ABV9DPA9_9ACTN
MSVTILVLISVAAAAVLIGVAFTVMGKGGQLARFEADHPPLDLPDDRLLTGPDVSRVALPLSVWGYHVRAVDDVLRRVVGALAERDAAIRDLEQRLAALDPEHGDGARDTDDIDGPGAYPETEPGSLSAAPEPEFAAGHAPDDVRGTGLPGDHDHAPDDVRGTGLPGDHDHAPDDVRGAGLPGDHDHAPDDVRGAGLPGDHDHAPDDVRGAGLPGDHDHAPDDVRGNGLPGDHDTDHEQWALHGGSETAGGAARASDPA